MRNDYIGKSLPSDWEDEDGDIYAVPIGDGLYGYIKSYHASSCGVIPGVSEVIIDFEELSKLSPIMFLNLYYTASDVNWIYLGNQPFKDRADSFPPPVWYKNRHNGGYTAIFEGNHHPTFNTDDLKGIAEKGENYSAYPGELVEKIREHHDLSCDRDSIRFMAPYSNDWFREMGELFLIELMDQLEVISKSHAEMLKPESGFRKSVVANIRSQFIKPEGGQNPDGEYGLMTEQANAAVRTAVEKYCNQSNQFLSDKDVPALERLEFFQHRFVTTTKSKRGFDEFFEWTDPQLYLDDATKRAREVLNQQAAEFLIEQKQEKTDQIATGLLQEFMDLLEKVSETNGEIFDTVCREAIAENIIDLFIYPIRGYLISQSFGLHTEEANERVRIAVERYSTFALALCNERGIETPQDRLEFLQQKNVLSTKTQNSLDEFTGWIDPERFERLTWDDGE